MKADQLLVSFETLANAPGGIKRLRELVLQLAVRGKLVPQDPRDEPASELLKRIAAEKARLVRDKQFRKPRERGSMKIAKPKYDIPQGWMWSCASELGFIGPRYSTDDDSEVAFVPMPVIPTDLRRRVDPHVRKWGEIKKGYTHVADGDVAIAKITPCFQNRKSCVFSNLTGGIGAGTTELHVLSPISLFVDSSYVLIYFKSPGFISGGMLHFTGTAGQQRVPRDYFQFNPLPLPPLAEQKRIVAKVDALMCFLDQLEAAQKAKNSTRINLRDSALAALRDAPDVQAVQVAWKRIKENMHTLFQHPDDVGPLRQTILQLAVRGRLVPQDPEDEPAQVLLKRIAAEKAQLVKDKKIRKPKPLPPINAEEVPFDVPKGWEWVRSGNIATKITDGEHKTPERSLSGHYLLSARNVHNGYIDLSQVDFVPPDEFKRLRKRCDPNIGDILLSCSGTIGRVATVDSNNSYCMVRSAALIKPSHRNIHSKFLEFCLRSPPLQAQMTARSRKSAQANLFLGQISMLLLTIPPLAEQKRIVAKVDELLAVCDSLEDKLRKATDLQSSFASSSIHHLAV